MSFCATLRSGTVIAFLMLGVCGYAAGEPGATNVVGAAEAVANKPVIDISTNEVPLQANVVGTVETVTNKPVVHVATNEVPQLPPSRVEGVVPVPLTEEGASWTDRMPRGIEDGDEWWRDRIEIGTRITTYTLTDNSRPDDNHYLGSINRLKEDQDYTPTKIYANVWPLKWIGAGISYEKISAKTWTSEPGEEYTDGTFVAKGPILSLLMAWQNRTRFTPFAELGQMLMTSSFDANPAWAKDGYQDLEVAKTEGGTVLGAGCAIQLGKRVELDLIYRRINATLVVDHVLNGSVTQAGRDFPLDSSWMGAGIKYRF